MSSSFADLGVPADLVAPLVARGITLPSPIQAATLPDSLAGRDVVGGAPTGSGKTVAFGLALAARTQPARPGRPRALVLTPTRELARQVHQELEWIGAPRRVRVASCYGGVGYGSQRTALRRGVEVLVACPGRLLDLITGRDVDLAEVELVVIDEADRMADMGFLPVVRRLLDLTAPVRQTLLFSATLDGGVGTLVRDYQREPARHVIAADERDASKATHHFWTVTRDDRLAVCADVVRDAGSTIVFCRTKRGADRVARQLTTVGLKVAALHGDRSQRQREQALEAFSRGRLDALVATDVAARGIHVDDVDCVLHFDPPADVATYTHRSGRTARAGATGTVVTLVQADQKREVAPFQRAYGSTTLTSPRRDLFSASALAEAAARVSAPVPAPTSTSVPAPVPAATVAEPAGDESLELGRVKWFDRRRGFGVIARRDDGDLFVHHSSIEGPGRLTQGQRVAFDVAAGKKGQEARRVRVLA